MVINFCGFRCRLRPKGIGSSEKDASNNGVMKKLMKVKRNGEEKEELQLCIDKCKMITLEDLIVSSPAVNKNNDDCMNIPIDKQYASSRKIHPSFDGDIEQPFLPISTSTNQPWNGEVEAGSSGFYRTKSKKKVSFRSPEVADVFVLHHSPN